MAVTTPTGSPSSRSTGPCSMCVSTNTRIVAGSRRSDAMPAGSPPKAASASRKVVPCASRVSSVAGSKRPASALLPIIEVPKRTPSSSPKATTSIATGRRLPRRCRSSTHAMAPRMPKMPS